MLFVDRTDELSRLDQLDGGGLAVVWGRRRVGKTRLLLEWCRREAGVYTVADQSTPATQRAYFARAVASLLPGFDEVTYPSWERLLSRLASDAAARRITGPIVIDELPYLVASSPELPSVLQRWIDHDAKAARLRVAIAGSSQRMMQGFVLSHAAPLFGRAKVVVDLRPLAPAYLATAFGKLSEIALVEHWAAWGGVPRYWELATARRGTARDRLIDLALDPLGALFSEPDRLLLEETPPAIEVRPILHAIGAGAHRVSEIGGRLGRAATSLGRPLDRLLGMGLIRRDVPFGEPPRGGKRSQYSIDDPFLRMWFRVVAPNRAALVAGNDRTREAILDEHWDDLVGHAWEDICRDQIPAVSGELGRLGPWRPASRYWRGAEPEWDIVANAVKGTRVLVGEARCLRKPASATTLHHETLRVAARAVPPSVVGHDLVRVLFVPRATGPRVVNGVHIVTFHELVGRSRR
jgi:AAA+ ATPase superfamily predicted ATPase